eukprot:4976758-Amphidinium_carterae.1
MLLPLASAKCLSACLRAVLDGRLVPAWLVVQCPVFCSAATCPARKQRQRLADQLAPAGFPAL